MNVSSKYAQVNIGIKPDNKQQTKTDAANRSVKFIKFHISPIKMIVTIL